MLSGNVVASSATVLAALLLAGPAGAGSAQGARAASRDAVAAQQSGRPPMLVTTEWLASRLDDPGVVVIQIESRRDRYESGHVPGARFLEMSAITWAGEPRVDVELRPVPELQSALEAAGASDTSHIVVYSTHAIPAARLWMTLDYLGHGDRTSILDGGLPAWKAEGRPLSTETPAVARGSLTPRPRPEMLVDAEWIQARLQDPAVVLIDARPRDEYTGADGGMGGRANPGHIPGAAHMYWEELVRSVEQPHLLDLQVLRAKFEQAGAAPDRTVVTYCMVGLRASVTYFTARLLGYDVKFYDGSWHDWGTRDLPYERGERRRR